LTLRKIIKTVATKCHILKPKCTKFAFGWVSTADPAGRAYSAPPNPLAVLRGPTFTSKGREGRKDAGKSKGDRRKEGTYN